MRTPTWLERGAVHASAFAMAAAGLVMIPVDAWAERSAPPSSSSPPIIATADRLQLPMAFEANRGQSEAGVQFLARGAGYSVFLGNAQAALALRPTGVRKGPAGLVRMTLLGGNPDAPVEGVDELPGRSHYLLGKDRGRWMTNVPTYAKVRYGDVYPGVDLVYYGRQRQLEYDLVLKPGADPRAIVLAFDGIDGLELDARGDLVLRMNGGRMVQRAPVIYQPDGAASHAIEGRYVLKGPRTVGIEVAAYDADRTLVIDPVLSYSTYLGGSGGDNASGIAVDAAGNAYITGNTASTDFPVFPSPGSVQAASGGGSDVFVTKLNASGTDVVYSTYLGGGGEDAANGIAVDAAGNAYVVGRTDSANFPVANALQPGLGGGMDGFVVKLNATGTALLYGTYLGGSAFDEARGVALDGSANVYVAGTTSSADFPASAGAYQPGRRGVGDAFVAKLDATTFGAASRVYATYLGGTDFNGGLGPEAERATAIAVDGAGNAYVTGSTLSSDFPTVGAVQAVPGSARDAFVSKLNAAGSALVYSTFLGGGATDEGMSIALDTAGNAYVTGFTGSSDFPTVAALQPNRGTAGVDAFVTKLNAAGSAFAYSTYLGGQGDDFGLGIGVDASGRAHVVGSTSAADFPVAGTLQPLRSTDAFVARLNAAGSALDYSTLLGGSSFDAGRAIALDASGAAYIVGLTNSGDFPTTPGAYKTVFADPLANGDAFVARITAADGAVGAAGGTVTDTAGSAAAFSVPAGVFGGDVSVTIEVLAAPGAASPPGFTGPATAFVSITLTPNPSPLPAPGATIRLPLASASTPGASIALFKYDPATGALTNTGVVGTVDAGGTTATFAGVTGFSVFVGFVPLAPTVVPFASFAATLQVQQRQFELKAELTLGAGSDGVNPATEPVALDVGAVSLTIPAGAFRADGKGPFKFLGNLGTARLEAVIRSLGEKRYTLTAQAQGADVGMARPVSVHLRIGNDEGGASVTPKR